MSDERQIIKILGRVLLIIEAGKKVVEIYLSGPDARIIGASMLWTYDGKFWFANTGIRQKRKEKIWSILTNEEKEAIKKFFRK